MSVFCGDVRAAAKGDVTRLETLCLAGVDLNQVDSFGRTPLHVVHYMSHIPIPSVLLLIAILLGDRNGPTRSGQISGQTAGHPIEGRYLRPKRATIGPTLR